MGMERLEELRKSLLDLKKEFGESGSVDMETMKTDANGQWSLHKAKIDNGQSPDQKAESRKKRVLSGDRLDATPDYHKIHSDENGSAWTNPPGNKPRKPKSGEVPERGQKKVPSTGTNEFHRDQLQGEGEKEYAAVRVANKITAVNGPKGKLP